MNLFIQYSYARTISTLVVAKQETFKFPIEDGTGKDKFDKKRLPGIKSQLKKQFFY